MSVDFIANTYTKAIYKTKVVSKTLLDIKHNIVQSYTIVTRDRFIMPLNITTSLFVSPLMDTVAEKCFPKAIVQTSILLLFWAHVLLILILMQADGIFENEELGMDISMDNQRKKLFGSQCRLW